MIRILAFRLIAFLMATCLLSCVHEFPEPPSVLPATLTVRHELPWRLYEFTYDGTRGVGRGDAPGELEARYIFEIYPEGTTDIPVKRMELRRQDLTLADFTMMLDLPVGHYDVWVWNDFVEAGSWDDLFYDTADFGKITYTLPYKGDTEQKDAFRGMFSVDVPSGIEADVRQDYEVTLRRPLTSHAFLSEDIEEFIRLESSRRGISLPENQSEWKNGFDFDSYTAHFTYTGYLSSTYSIFENRPVDSLTGVSFKGNLRVVDGREVLIGFDYFFINGKESSINVAVEIFDSKGTRVSYVPSMTIPVERGRATIVRGDFLTSKASGGVGVNPGFNGSFDIELK